MPQLTWPNQETTQTAEIDIGRTFLIEDIVKSVRGVRKGRQATVAKDGVAMEHA